MAYKVVNKTQLDYDIKRIADALRAVSGSSSSLTFPDGMVECIRNLSWRTVSSVTPAAHEVAPGEPEYVPVGEDGLRKQIEYIATALKNRIGNSGNNLTFPDGIIGAIEQGHKTICEHPSWGSPNGTYIGNNKHDYVCYCDECGEVAISGTDSCSYINNQCMYCGHIRGSDGDSCEICGSTSTSLAQCVACEKYICTSCTSDYEGGTMCWNCDNIYNSGSDSTYYCKSCGTSVSSDMKCFGCSAPLCSSSSCSYNGYCRNCYENQGGESCTHSSVSYQPNGNNTHSVYCNICGECIGGPYDCEAMGDACGYCGGSITENIHSYCTHCGTGISGTDYDYCEYCGKIVCGDCPDYLCSNGPATVNFNFCYDRNHDYIDSAHTRTYATNNGTLTLEVESTVSGTGFSKASVTGIDSSNVTVTHNSKGYYIITITNAVNAEINIVPVSY